MIIRTMNDSDIREIYDFTKQHLTNAENHLLDGKGWEIIKEDAISNVIPGYDSEKLDFGSYSEDRFAVLFVDMRGSTKRAHKIGAKKTFLTMHAFIPALLRVVENYNGDVIDIMGDGLMIFFKDEDDETTINKAAFCGLDMLRVKDEVINVLLKEKALETVDIGVGITYGNVIVTKIGIPNTYDVKVFGDCVNLASKYSSGMNIIKVSKEIEDKWPSCLGGRITFNFSEVDESYEVIIPD